jgi:hypothetical protein
MVNSDSEKRLGNETRDEVMFCAKCASQLRLLIALLDSRKNKTVRVFECQCGEVVWDD